MILTFWICRKVIASSYHADQTDVTGRSNFADGKSRFAFKLQKMEGHWNSHVEYGRSENYG